MANEPVPNETAWNLLKSEAVVVGLVTLLWYSLCMAYEVGFCQYFSIPRSVISLSIWQTIDNLSMASAALFGLLIGPAAFRISKIYKGRISLSRLQTMGLLTFIVFVDIVIADLPSLSAMLVATLILTSAVFMLFFADKTFASDSKSIQTRNKFQEMQKIGIHMALVAFITFTIVVLTPAIARHRAYYRDRYIVMTNANSTDNAKRTTEFVVLRIYDGVAYCKEIGNETVLNGAVIATFPIDNLRMETKVVGHLPGRRWMSDVLK